MTIDQIAAGAATAAATQLLNENQWHDGSIKGVAEEIEPFIKSAIEKATEGLRGANDNLFKVARKHCVENTELKALRATEGEPDTRARAVEAAYKEGRIDGFDSMSATDAYNEKRWQQSEAKASLEAINTMTPGKTHEIPAAGL